MDKAQTLLIFAGAAVILIILAFRFRKRLILSLLKLNYGKYSYEYLTFFKRIFVRSPFQYCFRDEFISHVLFILDKKEDLPVHKSSNDINFEGEPFFVSYKEFLKSKGDPYCFNAFSFDEPLFVIKILGYLEERSGQKCIAAYYFIDDKFFMGEYILKGQSLDARNALMRDFIDPAIMEDNFYVENTCDRIIHFQDTGFSVDIKFLTRENRQIIDLLRAYHHNMTSKTLVVEP